MKNFLALMITIFSLEAYAKLVISTYNIRNFDYDERSRVRTNKNHLYKTIKDLNADFIGVQEINKTKVFADYIKEKFSGKYETVLSNCGGAHDQRLGFVYDSKKFNLIKFEEDLRVSNPHSPQQGYCHDGSRPLAIGTFKMIDTGKTFVAISVHLKSGGRDKSIKKRFKQLQIISEVLEEQRRKGIQNFIVMGDFNSTEYIFQGDIQKRFKKVVKQMGLVDITESISCTSYWWGGRSDGKEYPSQLDHILVSGGFYSNVKGSNAPAKITTKVHGHCAKLKCAITSAHDMGVSYDEVSDHCPIASELR